MKTPVIKSRIPFIGVGILMLALMIGACEKIEPVQPLPPKPSPPTVPLDEVQVRKFMIEKDECVSQAYTIEIRKVSSSKNQIIINKVGNKDYPLRATFGGNYISIPPQLIEVSGQSFKIEGHGRQEGGTLDLFYTYTYIRADGQYLYGFECWAQGIEL